MKIKKISKDKTSITLNHKLIAEVESSDGKFKQAGIYKDHACIHKFKTLDELRNIHHLTDQMLRIVAIG